MDPAMGRPSPRRELQGPRPAPLRVSKDSYKIKKPPIAPPQPQPQPQAAAPPPPHTQAANHRPPVIIYAVSPKVIHTKPGDFMSLVQRLTGPSNSDSDSDVDPAAAALPSPAARLASIEKSVHGSNPYLAVHAVNLDHFDATDVDQTVLDRSSSFPGILSPLPSALPPISPSFFSPLPLDPSYLNFDLSPVFTNNTTATTRSLAEGSSFMATSPSNLLPSPMFLSPNACWEILTQFDL